MPATNASTERSGDTQSPIWLIAIAASAGGIQATRQILAALPSDLPAAIVVVQHRSARLGDKLAAVLRRRSVLPVEPAVSGQTIEPGRVYVARADSHLTVVADDGHFEYRDGTRICFVQSSANPLLETAATVFGGHVVAVVLTGGGRDATDGVQRVKAHGGSVIVQDQATSEHWDMPRSALKTGAVDYVLPLDAIAPALDAIVRGRPIMATARPSAMRRLAPSRPWKVEPNLSDYDTARAGFSWDAARRRLDGLPNGAGLNIAHEAVDRQAAGPLAARTAVQWIGRRGERRAFTYADLRAQTSRFANVLGVLGVKRGDVVVTLSGRIPALYISALGTMKQGGVYSPLFSAFGPEPIAARLTLSRARILVTTEALYRRKIEPMRTQLSDLEHVLLVREGTTPLPARTLDLGTLMAAASPTFVIPPTDPEETALLHFTSGTTGLPKGALHVHEAVVAHHATAWYALDFHSDDRFWCTADPGWVTGTSYGIIAPLVHGLTSIVDEADFDAERWYRILAEERISVWYTAPTAIRMLMKAGGDLPRRYDLSALRFLGSVGEPLNPEAVVWGAETLGRPFHDNWWQTETGGIMIANFASMDIRPGSMGRPLPGVEAAVLRRTPDGVAPVSPGEQGELALRPGWPSMFRGYLNDPERYAKCFRGGYYLTGDLARQDSDGYFWFVGRADDVIKSSGHLIGPFEVESALMEHRAVAEAGVIGKPDPVAGEIVKAFIELHAGVTADEALARDILGFARTRLGAAVAPKEIAFVPAVPKNRAGKIMRRLLKARELGLPEGDTSTLEAA